MRPQSLDSTADVVLAAEGVVCHVRLLLLSATVGPPILHAPYASIAISEWVNRDGILPSEQ